MFINEQAAINDVQTNGAMVDGLELVFNLIAKFEVVERLYLRRPSVLQTHLNQSILTTYTSILEFLLEANRYFSQKTVVRVAKSVFRLEEMTTKFTCKITSNSEEVEKYVRLISGEIQGNTDTSVSKVIERLYVLESLSTGIDHIETRTASVQSMLDSEFYDLQKILAEISQPIVRITDQISALEDNLKEEERLKIFGWLSTVPYVSHHRGKIKTLLPGSGQWLLQKPQFIKWMNSSSSSILWLHGVSNSFDYLVFHSNQSVPEQPRHKQC